ncbi:MAG: anaerobic ribonucleoside-triphosphate reductase activating protein [Simkaniaceae bacterium]|nr:MAG: anaerobic ribonucleoside-triphosphate reductase activating protein [Simkaniaceae bacterium]
MKEFSLKKNAQLSRKESINVGGLLPFSMGDYPMHLSAVIFCQGCHWRCRYCHNPGLQPFSRPKKGSKLEWTRVIDFLKTRQNLLEAVVFSGGEPLLQPCLIHAICDVKKLGFKIGLHTNGTSPSRFEKVLPHLDWVGFDIKAPIEKYPKITGVPKSGDSAWQCLELLLQAKIPYECRTTVHPKLHSIEDIQKITQQLHQVGVRHYVIQQFRKEGCNDEKLTIQEPHLTIDSILTHELESLFNSFSIR